MSIVPIVVTIIVAIGFLSSESSIVPVAIEAATIALVEVTSMSMRASISTAHRGVVPLVERFSVGLATIELPLAIFLFPNVVVQGESLVKQSLVARSIGH
jgi:hypothetical protein